MGAAPEKLDAPGTVCAFGKTCTPPMIGAGGFDQHHPIPEEFGGPAVQVYLDLCPNHHRRQHALIHYIYAQERAGLTQAWSIMRRFNTDERRYAQAAVDWLRSQNDGALPRIVAWPAPAARLP